MNLTDFTKSWRHRCITKAARRERKLMKQERSRRVRMAAKLALRTGEELPPYLKLNGYNVI